MTTVGNNESMTTYLITDQLGSMRVAMAGDPDDSTTEVREYINSHPFGVKAQSGGNYRADFRYTGHEYDAHSTFKFHYMGARYYDDRTGQFTGVDKVGEFASGYNYVGNDPIMRWDPDGNHSDPDNPNHPSYDHVTMPEGTWGVVLNHTITVTGTRYSGPKGAYMSLVEGSIEGLSDDFFGVDEGRPFYLDLGWTPDNFGYASHHPDGRRGGAIPTPKNFKTQKEIYAEMDAQSDALYATAVADATATDQRQLTRARNIVASSNMKYAAQPSHESVGMPRFPVDWESKGVYGNPPKSVDSRGKGVQYNETITLIGQPVADYFMLARARLMTISGKGEGVERALNWIFQVGTNVNVAIAMYNDDRLRYHGSDAHVSYTTAGGGAAYWTVEKLGVGIYDKSDAKILAEEVAHKLQYGF